MTMLNRTAARRRSVSRTSYAIGLLALIGAATALVVVVRVPAHSTTQLPVPPRPGPSAYDVPPAVGDGRPEPAAPGRGSPPSGTDAARSDDKPSPQKGSEAPPGPAAGHLARPPTADSGDPAENLHRSLVLSGLLGVAISLTGLVIVGSRRRMW